MRFLNHNIKFSYSSEGLDGPKVLTRLFSIAITDTFVSSLVVIFSIILIFFFLTKNLKILPSKRQCVAEYLYSIAEYLTKLSLGERGKKFIPFVGTLFFYIFFSNILGIFPLPMIYIKKSYIEIGPFLRSPTSDINATVSLALIAIGYVTYTAIKNEGFLNYLKGFISPSIILLPLNLIGEIAKPFSLAVRLFGNIFSGMLIMSLLYKYVPAFFPSFFHLYFDIFAGLIQSLIFTSLTTVYLSFVNVEEEK